MKIRKGFVSNSSSSSFVVIDMINVPEKMSFLGDRLVVNAELGETEFGWGPLVIQGWGSMVIFAYLQTTYDKYSNEYYLNMLESVIKKHLRIEHIEWKIKDGFTEEDGGIGDNDHGYIDHASRSSDDQNMQMFNNEEVLTHFIFGVNSHIYLDNDNRE